MILSQNLSEPQIVQYSTELFEKFCRDQDFYSIVPKVILFDGKYKKTSMFDFWIKILVQNHIQATNADRRV